MQRDFGSLKQIISVETGGQTLQSHRCDGPVTITTRAPEQVKLPRSAFQKRAAQFMQQHGIIAGSSRKSRIKGTIIKRHRATVTPKWVNAGFIPYWAVV